MQQLGGIVAEAIDLGRLLGPLALIAAAHQERRADQHEQHEHAQHDEQAARRGVPIADCGLRIGDF